MNKNKYNICNKKNYMSLIKILENNSLINIYANRRIIN